jgi:5'-phosphate synthase pdxT subunit
MEMVFIRAPIIERVGCGVEILAEFGGKPTLVQKDKILASTFHPELTSDSTVHRHFLGLIHNGSAAKQAVALKKEPCSNKKPRPAKR